MSADPPTLPVSGLLRCGLHGKVTHYFAFSEQFFLVGIFYQSECGCSAENYYFCTLNNPAMNR